MRYIATFAEAHDSLKQYIPDGPISGYSLDVIKSLMEYLGNPQDRLKVIHVAGTSGKTSTAYYISSLLTDVGYTTGLNISPHITELNERSQVNMELLDESDYCRELGLFLDQVDKSGLSPSHFELLVAFAFWLFDKRGVEYAVVEVGLGGLLDGTNVISNPDKICVITDIGLDHTEILGDTISKITYQKAGIIHANNTVFINIQSDDILNVIRDTVGRVGAKLNIVQSHNDSRLSDLPQFQQRNFGLALSTVESIFGMVGDDVVKRAVHTYIPGRMEVLTRHGKTLVMDGAHNEQKISALVQAMQQKYPSQEMTLLVSFGQNKQNSVQVSLELLRQLGSSIIVTQFDHAQDEVRTSIGVKELADYAKRAGFDRVVSEIDLVKALTLLDQSETDVNLIVGSFYLLENSRSEILK